LNQTLILIPLDLAAVFKRYDAARSEPLSRQARLQHVDALRSFPSTCNLSQRHRRSLRINDLVGSAAFDLLF
jgi:hypothetical protein